VKVKSGCFQKKQGGKQKEKEKKVKKSSARKKRREGQKRGDPIFLEGLKLFHKADI
jgi:hypothetical protein